MSEISREKMMEWLRNLCDRYWSIAGHHPHLVTPVTEEDRIICKAIGDLIKGMGEWKRQLNEPYYRTALSPIEEQIRDFGKEEK